MVNHGDWAWISLREGPDRRGGHGARLVGTGIKFLGNHLTKIKAGVAEPSRSDRERAKRVEGISRQPDRGVGLATRAFRRFAAVGNRWRGRRQAIEAILRRRSRPVPIDDDAVFDRLQASFSPRNAYTYDRSSLFRRGSERAIRLIGLAGLDQPGARILEIGCGDGMAGALLRAFGHDVTLTDLEDWRDPAASMLPMVLGNVCTGLPMPPAGFDLVYSHNTFEHVPDPRAALAEAVRLGRPGGLILLRFGPLFASAWGLHAYKTMTIPYAQFLFSEDYLAAKLRGLGIQDLGRNRDDLQPLNRWRLDQFERCWAEIGGAVVQSSRRYDPAHLGIVRKFPDAFQGRGLTFDDLAVKTLEVVLRLPSSVV